MICQVADPLIKLPCMQEESGGYRCEVFGPHYKHRIGWHTINHSLMGNGYACSAVPEDITQLAYTPRMTQVPMRRRSATEHHIY